MDTTSATSIQIHGVREINVGTVTDLSANNKKLSSSTYSIRLDIPMQANDAAPSTVTFFSNDPHAFDGLADNIHAATRRLAQLAGQTTDAEQSAIDQSPPHPMKKD